MPPDSSESPPFIPLSIPALQGREWEYIKECLDTNWVSSVGPFVERFEQVFAERVGVGHAVAVVNGTAALHLALLAADIGPDDEVLVSDLTFIASVNAIRYAGAHPVLVDVEPDFWQIDVERVAAFLRDSCTRRDGKLVNTQSGRTVKAILPVHILGHPVDMDPLLDLADAFGLMVIEDASEALGATYRGRAVGSMGRLSCFSFNGNKLITTGGGGMVVTDDADLAHRVRHLSTQAKADPVEYLHDDVGYNYRLTNILAALGCAQMELLDDYIAVKRRIAATYGAELAGIPGLSVMPAAEWADSTFWLYTVTIDTAAFGMDCRVLLKELESQGIQTRPLWQPMHLSRPHGACRILGGSVTENLYGTALSLPCSVGLDEASQRRVIDTIRRLGEG
jgi:perosamine synthetase